MQKYYDMDQVRKEFFRFSSTRTVVPRIEFAARLQSLGVLKLLNSSISGLDHEAQQKNLLIYGMNSCAYYVSIHDCVRDACERPFCCCLLAGIAILSGVEGLSFILDGSAVIPSTLFASIVTLSFGLALLIVSVSVHHMLNCDGMADIRSMVESLYRVRRGSAHIDTIGFYDLLVGDIILLTEGEIVPADVRIIDSDNFAVDQHRYTNDATPVEKNSFSYYGPLRSLSQCTNVALTGVRVMSGVATAIVVAQGSDAFYNAGCRF